MYLGFTPDLCFAHLVQTLDRNPCILGAVLDEDDTTARFDGSHNAREHFVGKFQLVIDVDHDRHVNRGHR